MKCKNCNAQYKTRELKCPYCGTENLIGKLWLIERDEAVRDYEGTKILVKKKGTPYIIDRVLNRILVVSAFIFVLVMVVTVLIAICFGKFEDMSNFLNKDEHLQIMEDYHKKQDYENLYLYMSEHNLFSKEYETYTQAALLYYDYRDFFISKQELLNELSQSEEKYDADRVQYKLKNVLEQSNYFYIVKVGIYSGEIKDNSELYEMCRQDAEAFLIGTMGLTQDEMELLKEEDYSYSENEDVLIEKILEREAWK